MLTLSDFSVAWNEDVSSEIFDSHGGKDVDCGLVGGYQHFRQTSPQSSASKPRKS